MALMPISITIRALIRKRSLLQVGPHHFLHFLAVRSRVDAPFDDDGGNSLHVLAALLGHLDEPVAVVRVVPDFILLHLEVVTAAQPVHYGCCLRAVRAVSPVEVEERFFRLGEGRAGGVLQGGDEGCRARGGEDDGDGYAFHGASCSGG